MNDRKRSTGTRPRRGQEPPDRSGTWILIGATAAMVAIAVLVVVLVTGGDDESPAPSNVRQVRSVAVEGTALPPLPESGADPAVGLDAPTVEGRDFVGESQSIPADGTPSMIVFAAHWCPHCQREIPLITDWVDAGGADGIDLVLVATGTKVDAPNYPPSQWLADEGWPGRVLVDDADGSAAVAYGLGGYPLMVFVDADGKVVSRLTGEQEEAALDAGVAALGG